jgi:lipopolysaccharide biosynthesis regulator YciM
LKNTVGLAWCRARLAEIYVDRGKRAEAESTLARIVVADYGSAVTAPVYIARFARANLALGKTDAAADAIAAAERVQERAGKVDDHAWQVAIVRGQVDAARGRRAAAIASLQRIVLETEKRGLKTIAADARSAMAKLGPAAQTM